MSERFGSAVIVLIDDVALIRASAAAEKSEMVAASCVPVWLARER